MTSNPLGNIANFLRDAAKNEFPNTKPIEVKDIRSIIIRSLQKNKPESLNNAKIQLDDHDRHGNVVLGTASITEDGDNYEVIAELYGREKNVIEIFAKTDLDNLESQIEINLNELSA